MIMKTTITNKLVAYRGKIEFDGDGEYPVLHDPENLPPISLTDELKKYNGKYVQIVITVIKKTDLKYG